MKAARYLKFRALLSAGAFASLGVASFAQAELVYESDINSGSDQTARVEEREATRQVIGTSERAGQRVQIGQQDEAPVAQVVVQNQSSSTSSSEAEAQALSRTELLRRERVRQELRNEDVLAGRLEELRLRDEQRRHEELLDGASTATVTQTTVVKEEVVATPAIDKVVAVEDKKNSEESSMKVGVQPRAGYSDMMNSSGYNVNGRYSAGLGVGVEFSDNIGFELGYTYADYGVSMNTSNSYVNSYQTYANQYGYSAVQSTLSMKQNVGDAGLKVYVLDSASRLRPFLSGGGAYSKSFINYDPQIIAQLNRAGMRQFARDYEVNSFLGFLGTGADVRLTKRLSIGASFRYYTVLSYQQSGTINNAAFYGYRQNNGYNYGNNYGNYYATMTDADKQAAGGTLARSGFYNIMAGVTFTF